MIRFRYQLTSRTPGVLSCDQSQNIENNTDRSRTYKTEQEQRRGPRDDGDDRKGDLCS